MSHPALQLYDLSVRYGAVTAVRGVDLEVGRGELICLLGASGCGKTTLLRAVAGFEVPTNGEIRMDGEQVSAERRWVPPELRRVGMVFQEGALFPHLDLRRNVAFGLMGRPDATDRVAEVLEWVGLGDYHHRYPDQLSGGQRQRAALVRALAPEPRLLLLDEPFANLDASHRVRLRDEVAALLRRTGATTILVTHDQEEALSMADRVAVMQEGRLLQVAAPETIYHAPDSVAVAGFVGDSQFLDGRATAGVIETPLGSLRTEAPDGTGRLLVRPESLRLLAEDKPGTPVTVRRIGFFGADAIYEARRNDGSVFRVRQPGSRPVAGAAKLTWSETTARYRFFASESAYWATLVDAPGA